MLIYSSSCFGFENDVNDKIRLRDSRVSLQWQLPATFSFPVEKSDKNAKVR